MRVLITGGAGYIGSHTAKVFAEHGHDLVIADNISRGHADFLKWGSFEKGDLRERGFLKKLFHQYEFDGVVHFAGFAYVEESTREPLLYYDNNVTGTINLLLAMREAGVKKIVFSSSCTVYGILIPELCLVRDADGSETFAVDENHPTQPINPYGETKLIVENILVHSRRTWGLNYISLRYFNAAGADPDCEVGEDHDPETHLIPLVLEVTMGKRKEISIFGMDYDTHDGTCVRDYIHVMDLAAAHVLALKRLSSEDVGEIYNLGNGNGYSVLEVIEAVKRVTKSPVRTIPSQRRSGDAPKLVASSQKIREELCFRATYPDIEEIIRTAYQWCRKRHGD